MNINNTPMWVDVEAEGENTGMKYFGRFQIRPYLTHAERTDVVRLSELYSRGIVTDTVQRAFMTTLAYLKFHIVETDAKWWDADGLNLLDESPIYKLAERVREVQAPKKAETPDEAAPSKKDKKKD